MPGVVGPPVFQLTPGVLASRGRPAPGHRAAFTRSCEQGRRHTVLRGMTGSGKTYTIANLIAELDRPTLVISPNKTLAAQLFSEFKAFFPDNAVEYFVSYYDYYQPEAYIPQSDTYIEKDALINDEIDRMRHSATTSLLERRDVVVVASVSCIYGIGEPETYRGMHLRCGDGRGDRPRRDHPRARRHPVRAQRLRLPPGDLPGARRRGRGLPGQRGVVAHARRALRRRDRRHRSDRPAPGRRARASSTEAHVYPASHYVTPADQLERALATVQEELARAPGLLPRRGTACSRRSGSSSGRCSTWRCSASSATATASRTTRATCRAGGPGEAPPTLIDYLPPDALVIIDESHVAVPQIRGMYHGDRSRKETLVEYGFRLPSAFDNRPLTFEEFRGPRRPDALRVGHAGATTELAGARRAGRPRSTRAGRWPSRSSGPPA